MNPADNPNLDEFTRLRDIDRRQDEVLDQLNQLNRQVEDLLTEISQELNRDSEAPDAPATSQDATKA